MTEKELELQEKLQQIKKMQIELERLREMVPVLPGTTVWVITEKKLKRIVPRRVLSIEIDEYGRSLLKFGWYKNDFEQVEANRLGEEWYLTREAAAEAAEETTP